MLFQCIFSGQASFAIFQVFRPFSIKKCPVPNFWSILWGNSESKNSIRGFKRVKKFKMRFESQILYRNTFSYMKFDDENFFRAFSKYDPISDRLLSKSH